LEVDEVVFIYNGYVLTSKGSGIQPGLTELTRLDVRALGM
jgi:hypothetical protein